MELTAREKATKKSFVKYFENITYVNTNLQVKDSILKGLFTFNFKISPNPIDKHIIPNEDPNYVYKPIPKIIKKVKKTKMTNIRLNFI
jgi:hypothetical protein